MHSNLSMSKVNFNLYTENHAIIKGVPKQPSLFLHIIEFFPLVNRSLYPITVLPTVPTNCTVPSPLSIVSTSTLSWDLYLPLQTIYISFPIYWSTIYRPEPKKFKISRQNIFLGF